ncbi:AraC family transcriptional regulator [Bradyrhizobium sp. CER78]|uniref:AraC family transcriptional regulator n=1 Tax=Bradyrhizobium sp. CER78 TaxID=3039162 RepID=UPI002448E4DA|nr:AraC family transcriptional regulator [Bradyrhizobium sp. CER78]MDH2385511.1 AraC family transcriptional regulator [Bradyrhizobium sp. CER78]
MPRPGDKAPSSPALDHQRLRRVMQFIDANLHSPIRLKDLADVANLSPFHFARAFRKATGESPHRFVRGCRLEKAKQLLIEGNATLAEVSLICNFSSQSSFTRAFTRAFGVPPGAFRMGGKRRR